QGRADGGLEAAGLFEVGLDQVGEHLGIRLRAERVAGGAQPLLDLQVVLEDAVVHDDEAAVAVGVRVRVFLGRATVRRPARVADADRPGHGLVPQRRLERFDAAYRAAHVELAAVQHGNTRGVVSAVLEALEPVDDDADRALPTDVPDDSTHAQLSFLACAPRAALRRAAQPSLTICCARSTASASAGTSLVITEPAATY